MNASKSAEQPPSTSSRDARGLVENDPLEELDGRGMHPEFAAEVVRLHLRYAVELVERYNVCPFARVARKRAQVRNVVLPFEGADREGALEAIERAAKLPTQIEIVQLIFPNSGLGFRDFDLHFSNVRNQFAARRPGRPVHVMAAFHPEYPLRAESPAAMVTFFRRTPFPTFQLARFDTVEQLRGDGGNGTRVVDLAEALKGNLPPPPKPSTSDRIADDNHAMAHREGVAHLDGLLRDIQGDRDRVFARFDDASRGRRVSVKNP